jgi:TRAP-type mannitol/chloroaromatic compound transport system permease small subunit
MKPWLALSRVIDAVTDRIGRILFWFVLAAVFISGVNAILRKAFNIGSNAWLEVQWYLFAAVFMLGAGYAFLKNAHVRIDFVSGRLSPRTRNWIDIIGIVFFLVPLCLMLINLGWPLFLRVDHQRDVAECRRPAALAGARADTARHDAALGAGALGTDQADRVPARADSRSAGPRDT